MASSTDVLPETPAGRSDDGPVGGSLTELAALEAARDEKRQLLDSAATAAAVELGPQPRLPDGCSPDDLPVLLRRYYWSEPAAEVLGHDPAELAGLAIGHLRLAAVRPPGSATVDVHRLAEGRDGGVGGGGVGGGGVGGGRAVIRLVTDDMPFLVDSVTAEVVRQGAAL